MSQIVCLLDNAAKFSPPSSQINLILGRQDSYARVSGRDQGPGMPVEHQESIFKLFNQLRQPTNQ